MVPDRHGRTNKADNDPRRRPSDGFRALSRVRFAKLVEDAITVLPQRYAQPRANAEVTVEELPPPPMVDDAGEIVLATFDRRRLTVYRRPLQMRAETRSLLEETVIVAIAQAVARAMGYGDDLNDLFE